MSDRSGAWRWTDDLGVQRLLETSELRAALASAVLPGSTLVWREGMESWVPASKLEELASALPARASVSPSAPPPRASGLPLRPGRPAPRLAPVRPPATGGAPSRPPPRPASSAPPHAAATRPAISPRPFGTPGPRAAHPAGRDRLPTLVGIPGPDEPQPSPPSTRMPIVVPSPGAGAAPVRSRITQAPSYLAPGAGADRSPPAAPPPPADLAVKSDTWSNDDEVTLVGANAPADDGDPTETSAPAPAAGSRPVGGQPGQGAGAKAANETDAAPVRKPMRSVPPPLPKRKSRPSIPPKGSGAEGSGAQALAVAASTPEPGAAVGTRPDGERKSAGALASPFRMAPSLMPQKLQGSASEPKIPAPPAMPRRETLARDLAVHAPAQAEPATQKLTDEDNDDALTWPRASEPPPPMPPDAPAPKPAAGAKAGADRKATETPELERAADREAGAPDVGRAPSGPEAAAPGDVAASLAVPAAATQTPAALVVPSDAVPEGSRVSPLSSDPPDAVRPSSVMDLAREIKRLSLAPGAEALRTPVSVPVSSVLWAGASLITLVVAAFLVGRCSSGTEGDTSRALTGLGRARGIARAAIPSPPKPCWVARQPVRWAERAVQTIPFEVTGTPDGRLTVGYAREPNQAVGLEITPKTGEVAERFREQTDSAVERIMRSAGPEGSFVVASAAPHPLRTAMLVPVSGGAFFLGWSAGSIAAADRADGPPAALWPLPGDEGLDSARIQPGSADRFALSFRRDNGVHAGWFGADRKPLGELGRVDGSGGRVGKPSSGWNGRELAVLFADRPDARTPWQIRLGHAEPPALPRSTDIFPLPAGGPGGDAFAPDIVGLDDGRWLIVWTEGASGSRAIRAQTLASDFTVVGDPIALSPPAGNFGQGVLGVADDYVGVVFLSKGDEDYELWGAVLQCGS